MEGKEPLAPNSPDSDQAEPTGRAAAPPGLTRVTEPPRTQWLDTAARAGLVMAGACALVVLAGAAFWIFVVERSAADLAYVELPRTPQLAADDAIGVAIPTASTLRVAPADERHWRGVATSQGPYAVLAAWTDAEVFVSRDDGRSFVQTLAGPGEVAAATFDDEGNLFAIRGRELLGVQHPDGSLEWRDLPQRGPTLALASGAGWLGWLHLQEHEGRGTLALLSLTSDQGVSWQHQVVPAHGNTENTLRIEPDGTIRVMGLSEDCELQETTRFEGHLDARPFRELAWPTEAAAAWGLGNHGWAYTIGTHCSKEDAAAVPRLCAVGPGPQPAVQTTDAPADWDLRVAANSRTTLALSGVALLQLDGNRASLVDENAPLDMKSFAVDGIGRAIGAVGGSIVRWSARHGWRVVFAPDGYAFEDRSVGPV